MVMQDKRKTSVVSTFDEWLVVTKGLVADQSDGVGWNRLKKSKFIPGGFTKKHQKHDCVLPHDNFEDLSNLKDIFAEHFCDHNESSFVQGSSDHNLITQQVTRLQHGGGLQNVSRCRRRAFPRKYVDRFAEQPMETPEKKVHLRHYSNSSIKYRWYLIKRTVPVAFKLFRKKSSTKYG